LLLLLDAAGALERLVAALRFAPFEDDVARLFDDLAFGTDFARPFDAAGFFAPDDRLVERDALVLRALAGPLLARFGFAWRAVPPALEALVRFVPEPSDLVSAICHSLEVAAHALPGRSRFVPRGPDVTG
jgi:hypothetical protein